MSKYDYVIVGAGLYGATFAYKAKQEGKKCLVIDRRPHIGGNIYCEEIEGINVHKYGAHIFHTSNKEVWDFVNSIVEFNRYTNSPVANYEGKYFNLPFNMNTFYQMWGVTTPAEAKAKIEEQKQEALQKMKESGIAEPRNSPAAWTVATWPAKPVSTPAVRQAVAHPSPCAPRRIDIDFRVDRSGLKVRRRAVALAGRSGR